MKNKYLLKELSDSDFTRLIRAEKELAECEGCTGECRKTCPDYFLPVISNRNGKVEFDCIHCQFYKAPVQSQPQKISEVLIDTLRWLSEFEADRKQRYIANRKQHLQRVLKQYGLKQVSDSALADILLAERQNAACEKCHGLYCVRFCDNYQRYEVCADGSVVKVECEVGKRQRQAKLAENSRYCLIPDKCFGKTFADYEITDDNAQAVRIAKWFVKEIPDRWLYCFGECGSGKTFLAAIIAQAWLQAGKSVVFGDVPTLLKQIKDTFDGEGNTQKILDRFRNCDLLVLDDIGAGQITEWNIGQLYEILNSRYNAIKHVIITSNYDLQGLEERLKSKDKFSAKRIVSRLSEMCEVGYLGEIDRRRQS